MKYVLLLSDDMDLSATVSTLLATADLETRLARSFPQADSVLSSQPLPECLVLDLSLSQSRCLDYLRTLRSSEHYARLPILVMIDYPDPKAIADALQTGANRYLTKAFVHRNLRQVILDMIPAPT